MIADLATAYERQENGEVLYWLLENKKFFKKFDSDVTTTSFERCNLFLYGSF